MKGPRQVWKRREQSQERRELVILSRRGGKKLRGGGDQAIHRKGQRLEASLVLSLAEDGAGGEHLSNDFESLREVPAVMSLAWRWITVLSQSSPCHECSLVPRCLILQGYPPQPPPLPGVQWAGSTWTCLLPPSPQNHISALQDLIFPSSSPKPPCLQLYGPCGVGADFLAVTTAARPRPDYRDGAWFGETRRF